jgi:deazaflavin-dependent oxidoreductase (nitroreductase family)
MARPPCCWSRSAGAAARHGAPRSFTAASGEHVIVASALGADEHPDWYRNLTCHPGVRVQVRAEQFDAQARTVTAGERDCLWQLMVSIWPDYQQQQSLTSRQIPVIALRRT